MQPRFQALNEVDITVWYHYGLILTNVMFYAAELWCHSGISRRLKKKGFGSILTAYINMNKTYQCY